MRSITPEELASAEFNAVWHVIKEWDIGIENEEGKMEYAGGTGSNVAAILDALKSSQK